MSSDFSHKQILQRPPSAMATYKRVDYTFQSLGETCAADLYLPTSTDGPWPAVITEPGFAGSSYSFFHLNFRILTSFQVFLETDKPITGVKEMLIPSYAQSLATSGIACLSIDFIGFGASGGSIRQDIKPFDQIQTLRDGLDCLEQDDRFNSKRLGVWGTSLGGAHSLVLAAEDKSIKAVVALIPHISVPVPGLMERVGLGIPIISDIFWRTMGYPPATLSVTGNPGNKAVMTTDGVMDRITQVTKQAPRYKNEVTLASLLQMVSYSTKGYARRVKCPLLAISAIEEGITPASKIHDAVDGMANVECVDFEGSHFELFGDSVGETVRLTTEFLRRHL